MLGEFPCSASKSRLAAEFPSGPDLSLYLQTGPQETCEDAWAVIHWKKQLDLLMVGSVRAPQALLSGRLLATLRNESRCV